MDLISSLLEKINQQLKGNNSMEYPTQLGKTMEWFNKLSSEDKDKITWFCSLSDEEIKHLKLIAEYRKAFGPMMSTTF